MPDLDAIDWASLHGSYRSAEDVPGQLRALRSPDQAERRDALMRLSNAVEHQGTRWQVSAPVVPFLVELIDDPAVPDRTDLVSLVRYVGIGPRDDRDLPFDPAARFELSPLTPEQEARTIEQVYDTEDGLDDELIEVADALAARWDADAYWAAAAHVEAYRRWLADGDPGIAARAAELLAWFTVDDATLTALLGADRDSAVRTSANLTLAHLPVPPDAIAASMTSLLDHPSDAVRLSAAIALAYQIGEGLPDQALGVLAAAKESEAVPEFPKPWRRAPRGFVALALQRLGLG